MVQTTGEKVGKENGAELMRRETVVTFKQAHAQEVGESRVEKKQKDENGGLLLRQLDPENDQDPPPPMLNWLTCVTSKTL